MISGPWTLYDPVFGRKAIDFGQMRSQVLAAGDAILALDGLPRAQIAGDYPALQAELDQGTKTAARLRTSRSSRPVPVSERGWIGEPAPPKGAVAGVLVIGLLAALLARSPGPIARRAGSPSGNRHSPSPGPGGSDYTHHFRVSAGGSGSGRLVRVRAGRPRPRKAPLAIVMHGYGEFAGYASM